MASERGYRDCSSIEMRQLHSQKITREWKAQDYFELERKFLLFLGKAPKK